MRERGIGFDQGLERWIMPQRIVVVEIFVAQGQSADALSQRCNGFAGYLRAICRLELM
jgi:hypothetical protein